MERIFEELEREHRLRESIQRISGKILKLCSQAIALIHSGNLDDASKLIRKAGMELARLNSKIRSHPQLRSMDQIQLAHQELLQARMLYRILTRSKMPSPGPLEMRNPMAFLGALADLIGELRRCILDQIRLGEINQAQRYFELMERIYSQLLPISRYSFFPALRHKLDIARNLVMRTREELTLGSLISRIQSSNVIKE